MTTKENRAHWPTKEKLFNRQNFGIFFSGPHKKLPGRAPNGAGKVFFRLKKTSPTFWAERILILRFVILGFFWISNFQISKSHISKFPEIWLGPYLGPPWAQLGPGLGPGLGPAWARAWARAWASGGPSGGPKLSSSYICPGW